MRHLRGTLLALLLGVALPSLPALPAAARPVTLGDISLEVPSSYSVKEIDRGVEVKSSEEDTFLFIEKYEGKESDALIAEHDKYWAENGVETSGEPTVTTGRNGDIAFRVTSFDKATWKGAPTVVRYLQLGPVGPKEEFVLLSLWAETPEVDKARDADVTAMVGSMNVKVSQ